MIENKNITNVFKALNSQIELHHGFSLSLVVCGGTALCALGLILRTTKDVDVLRQLIIEKNALTIQPINSFPDWLITSAKIVQRDFNLPEKPDTKDENAEWKNKYYEMAVERKKLAEKFLEEHLAGNSRFKGSYSSHINRREKNTEETDFKLLRDVKEANPDIEIEIGFRSSHCCHGSVIYGLSLRVQMDSFKKAQNSEQRLTEFMKYIKQKFPFKY